MQITGIDGYSAHCVAKGVERDVSLFLLQEDAVKVGDHVLIRDDYVVQIITAEEAQASWELFDRILMEYARTASWS